MDTGPVSGFFRWFGRRWPVTNPFVDPSFEAKPRIRRDVAAPGHAGNHALVRPTLGRHHRFCSPVLRGEAENWAGSGGRSPVYPDHAVLRTLGRGYITPLLPMRRHSAWCYPIHNIDNRITERTLTVDMLFPDKIAEAKLTDWRKLAQGIHARYLVNDFATGAAFVTEIGETGNALGHYPKVSMGNGHVDLKLTSDDAIYRDGDTEHIVEWVTQKDIDLARRIEQVAAGHGLSADPASVSVLELGLDTANPATIAPVWAALLTGNAESQGHGSPSDEIRDATGRVPNLWFGDANDSTQKFHLEVYVPAETRDDRVAAVIAAGGRVVDDSNAPGLTVLADQDGNLGVLCVA